MGLKRAFDCGAMQEGEFIDVFLLPLNGLYRRLVVTLPLLPSPSRPATPTPTLQKAQRALHSKKHASNPHAVDDMQLHRLAELLLTT